MNLDSLNTMCVLDINRLITYLFFEFAGMTDIDTIIDVNNLKIYV